MRRWQFVTLTSFDAIPVRRGRAWTETGAWRAAHRWRRRRPFFRQHFACGDVLAEGCPGGDCPGSHGWFEVRVSIDDRTPRDILDDDHERWQR